MLIFSARYLSPGPVTICDFINENSTGIDVAINAGGVM